VLPILQIKRLKREGVQEKEPMPLEALEVRSDNVIATRVDVWLGELVF